MGAVCPRAPASLFLSRLTRLAQVCKPWRRELEARGFCNRTAKLCTALAEGGDAARLGQNALRRLNASTDDAERALCLDGDAFLEKWEGEGSDSEEWEGSEKSLGWKGSLQEWLQAASQEPDASLLSLGAASTAQSLGLALVRWVGKPQGRYPESYALTGHLRTVHSVALSRDGTRAASVSGSGGVSGSGDKLVKIWNAETGAEVSSLE